MPSDLKKFINPKFLRTIDLDLLAQLFARHGNEEEGPFSFDGDAKAVRQAVSAYFTAPVTEWSEGLIADLHRVADLGTGEGLQLILNETRRQGVVLFPDGCEAAEDAPAHQDAKHVALHTYLNHHSVFEAAADFQALRAPTAMAEFRGPERGVSADLTDASLAAFKTALVDLLAEDLHGDYCRLGPYQEKDELNLVVSHGAPVTTTPIVSGDREQIITLRAVKYAALRYVPTEGLLRIGGVARGRQATVAELFSEHIIGRPGFFSGSDARDLYTLEPVSRVGPTFAFNHAHDDRIAKVRILAAAADLYELDNETGDVRLVRSWVSKDGSGAALNHFAGSEVRFGQAWRLGEMTFRVTFRTEATRPAQVTVRLKPPGTLAFRRTRFEKAIHDLIARNGLEKTHDAALAVDAAE